MSGVLRMRRRREDPREGLLRAIAMIRRALAELKRAEWRARRLSQSDPQILKYILALQLVLERVLLRLETIAVTGIITRDLLRLPLSLVKEALSEIRPPVPALSSALLEIENVLGHVYTILPETPESIDVTSTQAAFDSEQARAVLREALREAERRIEEAGAQ